MAAFPEIPLPEVFPMIVSFPRGRSRAARSSAAGRLAALLLCLSAPMLQAQDMHVVRVGPANDTACDHSDLFEALRDAPRDVPVQFRVVATDNAQQPGYENLGPLTIVGRDVVLSGGYASCSATSPSSDKRSRLRSALGSSSVLRLFSLAQPVQRTVRVQNFEITGGEGVDGGGVFVTGANRLELFGSQVYGNHGGDFGGGIYVQGAAASLLLDGGSQVLSNSSAAYGGGVACSDGTVELGRAEIGGNVAFAYGGGLYGQHCRIRLVGGKVEIGANRADASANPTSSVFEGGARASGGGIYLSGSSELIDETHNGQLVVAGNAVVHRRYTSTRMDRGLGGGLLLRDDTRVELRHLHLVNNSARLGAGARLRDRAQLIVAPQSGACPLDDRYLGCASIANNIARGYWDEHCDHHGGQGGAIALQTQSRVELARTALFGNQAHGNAADACANPRTVFPSFGSAFDVASNSMLTLRDSLLTGHIGTYERDVVRVRESGRFLALRSTLADNSRAVPLLRTAGGGSTTGPRIELSGSILHQLHDAPLFESSSTYERLTLRCVTVSRSADFAAAAVLDAVDVDVGEPGFVARGSMDFRLREDSTALDRCAGPVISGHSTDLDGVERGQVVSQRIETAIDRGAYERQGSTVASDLRFGGAALSQVLPRPGQVLEWYVEASNGGPAGRQSVALRIELDPALRGRGIAAGAPGWSCQARAEGWDCLHESILQPGEDAPTLRFSARAPEQPALLQNRLRLIPGPDAIDPDPGNDVVDVRDPVAMDADIDAGYGHWTQSEWRRGDAGYVQVNLRSLGPQVAHRPQFDFLLPAVAQWPQALAEADEGPTRWSCTGPVPENDGRQRLRCVADFLEPLQDQFFLLHFGVPRNAPESEWRVDWRVQSPSDPDAAGRKPNDGTVSVRLAEAWKVELRASGPAEVRHQQAAEWRLRLINHGAAAADPVYVRYAFFQLGESVSPGEVDGLSLVVPTGYACEFASRAKSGDGALCELRPALPAGASVELVIRATPRYPVGPRWLLDAQASEGKGLGASALVESRVAAGSPPPPLPVEDQVFGSSFE
jgi:hypothetical protein